MSSVDGAMTEDQVLDFSDPATPHNAILIVEDKKFFVQTELLSEGCEFFKNLFEPEIKELNETIQTEKDEEVKPKKKKSFKLFRRIFKASKAAETKVDEVAEEMKEGEHKIEEIELKDISAAEFGEFLKIFYPGDFKVTATNYHSLAALSHRSGYPKGLNLSQSFVLYNFNEFEVVDMVEFAVKYDMEDIKVIAADKPDDSQYPWPVDFKDKDFDGCSCHICVFEGLNIAYGYPFNQGSFVAKNKHRILNASEKAKAFILEELIKAKL